MADLDKALEMLRARAANYRHDTPPTDALLPRSRLGPDELLQSSKDAERSESPDVDDRKFAPRPQQDRPSEADVALLVALADPELHQVHKAIATDWRKDSRDGVVYNVGDHKTAGGGIRIVTAVQNDMGMVPAAILATKTVRAWRPKLCIMVGICAGVKGKVNFGDIVVGRQLFDYGSGKIRAGRLYPDYQPVSLDEQLCSCAVSLAADAGALTRIRDAWPTTTGRPDTELHAHIGSMASGAAVIADDTIVEGVQEHKRGLLALDMEAYGFARGTLSAISPPRPLVIKGVQDFADDEKSDQFREYAAFVSARYVVEFLDRFWEQICGEA